ncbi:MAG: hypothetical protein MR630_01940 [Selenomonas sp.]|uniref:hypothetical protein n=1 Tax=Selenomonas sp. TaxID=2053611 RepID=UPI0025F52808|nr:hypothetical protein [Selenomonas sp.]MCI6231374.1 hypothetical protein [Selenomonas sp.]
MMAVYALPTAPMIRHVEHSLPLFETEHDGYSWAPGRPSAGIDNLTSSVMVQSAILPESGSVVQDAMLNGILIYTAAPYKFDYTPGFTESSVDRSTRTAFLSGFRTLVTGTAI